jgi:hypothetical protein
MNHEVEITTCSELLGLYKPDQIQRRTIHTLRVNIHEFEQLQSAGQRLVRSFFDRAREKLMCQPEDSFEPSIFGWIALNSWASCVTGSNEADRPYLNALMLDRELNQRFSVLLEQPEFQDSLGQFRDFWPILQPLPHSRIRDHSESRQERVLQALEQQREGRPRFRPGCAARHHSRRERIPMDWPHTLSAIYQVRCNLFHGSKSLHSDVDTQIVFNSFRVLLHVLSMLDV